MEAKALRKSYKIFMDRVNPADIVLPLFMEHLLTTHERSYAVLQTREEDDRLQGIYEAVERHVSANPLHFHTLVEILQREPALKDVGDHMKGL